MAVANDKKRKNPDKNAKKASPAKKRKVDTTSKLKPKSKPVKGKAGKGTGTPKKQSKATTSKKVTATKVKKVSLKGPVKKTPKKATPIKSVVKKAATGKEKKKAIPTKGAKKIPSKIAVKGKKATPAKKTPLKAKVLPLKAKLLKAKLLKAKLLKAKLLKAKGTPLKAKGSAVKAKASPVKAKGKPLKAKGSAVKAKGTPLKAKASTVKAKGSPVKKVIKKTPGSTNAKSLKLSAKSVTKAKLVKSVTSKPTTKAQATASKAKQKALKQLTKPKPKLNSKVVIKSKLTNKGIKQKTSDTKSNSKPSKPQNGNNTPKPVKKVEQQEKKETAEQVTTENKGKDDNRKRKNPSADENVDTQRKRRIITPNKKYADFETNTSPKRISELRAFLQDKKKVTPTSSPEKSTENTEAATATEKKIATPKRVAPIRRVAPVKRVAPIKKSSSSEDIKVYKASEMKPAEKLLKKLQKKLEKEAKAASVIKPNQNKDKVTAKITKVVTYNKANLPKIDQPLAPTLKTKLAAIAKAKSAATLKTKSAAAPKVKLAAKQNASKPNKETPKIAQTPEKAKARKVKELKKENRPIQAHFSLRKNIKQADDTNEKCWVTGIDVFPSGEIILVDMAQKKIKLFSKTFECLSQVKLDTIPQDISISPLNASSAFFTKPFSKEGIQKVSMDDGQLTLKESFWTNGTNRGIKCIRAGILTSVQDGRYHDLDINCFKMDLLDYEGNVLQSVSKDLNGSRLFKLPLYFDVSNTGKQMIVSDCIRHNSYVISVDMSGKVKFKFTGVNNNLITPRGLTVDDENNVYVTEWEHHNVYVLSPTGKRLQLLIHHSELLDAGLDGLQKPYQLCYKKTEEGGMLIVSQEACNSIKVFKILKNQVPEKETPKAAEATEKNAEKPAEGETTATAPVAEGETTATAPVAAGQTTAPVTAGQATVPATAGHATTPATAGQATAPATAGETTTPATIGQATAPETEAEGVDEMPVLTDEMPILMEETTTTTPGTETAPPDETTPAAAVTGTAPPSDITSTPAET